MLQDQTQPPRVDISLVGSMSVGKSALIMRLCDDLWQPAHLTANAGFDFRTLLHNVSGRQMKLRIWDTAGQERFHAMAPMTYRRAQAIILVYSITSRETFDALPRYIEGIEKYAHPEVVKIVVGNMLDMNASRAVSKAEATKFAADNRCMYAEASALTNEGVATMFNIAIECVLVTPALSSGRLRNGMSGVELDLHLEDNRTTTGIYNATNKTTFERPVALSALHQLDLLGASSAQVAQSQYDKSAEEITTLNLIAAANAYLEAASSPPEHWFRSRSSASIASSHSDQSVHSNTDPNKSSSSSSWKTVRTVSSRRSSVSRGSIFTMRRHAREQARMRQRDTRAAYSGGSLGLSRSQPPSPSLPPRPTRGPTPRRWSSSTYPYPEELFGFRAPDPGDTWPLPHGPVPLPAARDRSSAYSRGLFGSRTPDDMSPLPHAPVPRPARSSPPLLVEGQPKHKPSFLSGLFCCCLPIFNRPSAIRVDRAVQVETDVVQENQEESGL